MKKGKWKEMLEFDKGNCAVYNGEDLMLKQPPNFISVIPKRLEKEVHQWLADKAVKEENQKIFKLLLDKEYRKEVQNDQGNL